MIKAVWEIEECMMQLVKIMHEVIEQTDMKNIELARKIEYKQNISIHNYHFFAKRTLTLGYFV